jgi:peptide/nickel transport system substrate-binding protein
VSSPIGRRRLCNLAATTRVGHVPRADEGALTMKRRDLLKLTAGAAIVGAGSAGRAGAQTRRILILASGTDPGSPDPHVSSGYAQNFPLRNIYDSLVRVEGTPPRVVPHLARSWTVTPDGMEYTFVLDPAAKFHDGAPVNAAAVEYSFKRLLRINQGNAWMVAGILDQNSVQVVDAGTVKIKLVRPFVAFPYVLPWLWVVNPALVEANKGNDDGQTYLRGNTAGSGAFRVRRNEPGNLVELERVPNAWKPGSGNLTGAIWRIVREAQNQRLLVQRGEVHIALDLTSEDMNALRDRPGVALVVETEFRPFSIKMNVKRGPLMDVNLRRAVSYAFDYDAMLEASGGYTDLMIGPLPSGIFGHDPNLQVYRRDLAKAREHLARSATPNGGFKLTTFFVQGLEQQRRWALILLDALRQLNIELDIRPTIFSEIIAMSRSPETMVDFFPIYQSAQYADPDNIAFVSYHSSRNGNWQNPVYSNPQVDELILRGRAETDEGRRREIYRQFQRVVVEDAPDLFGVLEKRKLAMRTDVLNFRFTPVASNSPELADLSLR